MALKNKGSSRHVLKIITFYGALRYFDFFGELSKKKLFSLQDKKHYEFLYIFVYRFLFWLIFLINTFDKILVNRILIIIKININNNISDKINTIIILLNKFYRFLNFNFILHYFP